MNHVYCLNCATEIEIENLYLEEKIKCNNCGKEYMYEYDEDSEYNWWPLLTEVTDSSALTPLSEDEFQKRIPTGVSLASYPAG